MGPKVKFIYSKSAGVIDSGLIASIGGCAVGITNQFGHDKGIAECIEYACKLANELPLVGYGSDEELRSLKELGFEGLGKLRV